MKILLLLGILIISILAIDPKCGDYEQINCQTDVNYAFMQCEKAAKEKGKDTQVDISCMKYFARMTEDCWGCICWFAREEKWKVIGCD
jgi:hypothetical protein